MSLCIGSVSTMGRALATTLREWLAGLFPELDIALAPEDDSEQALAAWIRRLRTARVALLCVTPDATASPWLHFQLGLMHRHVGRGGLVAPIFMDVAPADVSPTPLHVFQATRLEAAEFGLLVRQIGERVEHTGPDAAGDGRFNETWPAFRDRARRIAGPALPVFIVSIALPHRTAWFRYDPSGNDGDWVDTMRRLLPGLASGPFGMDDVEVGTYDCLDVAGERWIEPPAIVSRVGTSHVALVHPLVVDTHGGDARTVAHAISLAVDGRAGGLKVLTWKDRFVVGTHVT